MKLHSIVKSKSYKSPWLSEFGARRDLQGFLARRCSREFLALYVTRHQQLLDRVAEPGLFLDAVPEVRLAERLHEFGLLPEEKRRRFVEIVSGYAIEGEDTYAVRDTGIRALFTDDEYKKLLEGVRSELLPRLDDVRRDWEGNHTPDQNAEEHMDPLLTALEGLKDEFWKDDVAVGIIERETEAARKWIGENMVDEPERDSRVLGTVETSAAPESARSVFEDVDASESGVSDGEEGGDR